MTALAVQSSVAFSFTTLAASVLNMKQFVDWNKWTERRELLNFEEVQSSSELHLWRNRSSSTFTARHFSKNQNAIGPHHSQNENVSSHDQKENQQLLDASLPSINFTTASPVELQINATNESEKIDSNLSQKSVTITRRISKPSRHEFVQISTYQTRKHQRDRYSNYHSRLEKSQLYSLILSSNNVECYGTNCQPSVFNASHRCRTLSSEKLPLMNDQDIKQNISYISLTNLSNIIDREPNVTRKNSYSQSTTNILMHKPSLFLADIFNKMTHEQRTKSIAQLTTLHENLTKSNPTIDKLQRTTSLPDLNRKPTKLHSVASLLTERTAENIFQTENQPFSISSTEQKHTDEDTISEPLDKQIIPSPVTLASLPEDKLPQENIESISLNNSPAIDSAISPIFIKSSKSNTNNGIGKAKTSRTTHFLDAELTELNETPSKSKLKSFKTSKTEQTNTQPSSLSSLIQLKSFASSSNSIVNSTPIKKQPSDNETISNGKNNHLNQETNHEELYPKKDPAQPSIASSSHYKVTDLTSPSKDKQLPSSSPHFQSSNDQNEIENSSNDVTDHLSQQDINISNTSPDKSTDIPYKEFTKTRQILPLLKEMDEVSQHSQSSRSHLKKPPSSIISPGITIDKETKPKPAFIPVDDGDTSMVTRTTVASTNLTITDDDDEQSKLINEQLKRSSLGLARDSLELLRNASPHHSNSDEQFISYPNNDSKPGKRKSVLKSRFDSSDNLPTPELISYIAIDEIKGDKNLMEKQMRRRSLTVGGGTVVSCTSPKPKRDSLILLQERYSGSMTPHSGCYHLSNSDSKHVEFIREPGNTITPALHIGRGTKSKYASGKSMSPSVSNEYYQQHHFSSRHTFDSSERSKSEMSLIDNQQQIEVKTPPLRSSLDSISRHPTSQSPLTSTTASFIDTDDIEEEKICLNKSDYDEMVRLLMTPLSKKKKKSPVKSSFESNIELCITNRLTIFQNLIVLIVLIFFYLFIFIKSHYWQDHNQK